MTMLSFKSILDFFLFERKSTRKKLLKIRLYHPHGIWPINYHSHGGPAEVEDCSLPPPNMAATKSTREVWPRLAVCSQHTLTQLCIQTGMGRENNVTENRDRQGLNFVTGTLCVFVGRWRTSRWEMEDLVMFGMRRWGAAIFSYWPQ